MTLSSTVLWQPPTITAAVAVYLHSFYTTTASGSQATTAVQPSGVPVLQLREGGIALAVEPMVRTTLPKVDKVGTPSAEVPMAQALMVRL
jgi:hypothetical protein